MKYVKVIPISSNNETSHVVYLDSVNGNDINISIYEGSDEISEPNAAKTLQAAINKAVTAHSVCEIRIIQDYVLNNGENVVISTSSNNSISHVLYINQEDGDDTTAAIDDDTKPFKTLQDFN